MRYFHLSQGLRGCYMPDDSTMLKCATRRELKAAIEWEARDIQDAGFHLNRRDVGRIANAAWKEVAKRHPTIYDFVVPYGRTPSRSDRAFGIFVSVATRADYVQFEKENG